MSKRRVSSTKRNASSSGKKNRRTLKSVTPTFDRPSRQKPFSYKRFLGLSLLGGKNERTSFVVLDYYPEHEKVFLKIIIEKIGSDDSTSGDQKLFELISEYSSQSESITFDVPLQLPVCLTCELKCPGYEKCKEPSLSWMWKHYERNKLSKKNLKLFTPYTQRCVELFFQTEFEEPYYVQDAMGANMAPLTSRAHFLKRRLKLNCYEIFPPAVFHRLGSALGLEKNLLKHEGRSLDLDISRSRFIKQLMDKKLLFIYEQDVHRLVDNADAFDAFLCAYMGFLKYMGKALDKPKSLPEKESWIEIPKEDIEL